MRKKSMSTNDDLKKIIGILNVTGRHEKARVYRDIASRLTSSRKNRAQINVSMLKRNTKAKDVIAVPGKLLGSGSIDHAVTVAAVSFSAQGKEKVLAAGGKCITFEELLKENPRGSNIKILGGL